MKTKKPRPKSNLARSTARSRRLFSHLRPARSPPPYNLTDMNNNRAEWARSALDRFKEECHTHNEDDHTNISDLIADLLHLASQRNLVPSSCILRALNHFECEASGQEE